MALDFVLSFVNWILIRNHGDWPRSMHPSVSAGRELITLLAGASVHVELSSGHVDYVATISQSGILVVFPARVKKSIFSDLLSRHRNYCFSECCVRRVYSNDGMRFGHYVVGSQRSLAELFRKGRAACLSHSLIHTGGLLGAILRNFNLEFMMNCRWFAIDLSIVGVPHKLRSSAQPLRVS